MLTLSIFRHAKSSWDDGRLKDADRPLNERGRAASPMMGQYMLREQLRPDLVLSSPSVRTRETCELAFAGFPNPPELQFENVLYLASARTLLGRIRKAPETSRHLMLVGHNPGMHLLALELLGTARAPRADEPANQADLKAKLPTGGLVVVEFDCATWADIGPGRGRLARFVAPRMLGTI